MQINGDLGLISKIFKLLSLVLHTTKERCFDVTCENQPAVPFHKTHPHNLSFQVGNEVWQ